MAREGRKPAGRADIVSLTGGPVGPDLITDADYAEGIAAQDAVLIAQGVERRILGKLRVRLERGAVDGGKRYYFDRDRGIVRRREQETG